MESYGLTLEAKNIDKRKLIDDQCNIFKSKWQAIWGRPGLKDIWRPLIQSLHAYMLQFNVMVWYAILMICY